MAARRVSLPTADDLFRPTGEENEESIETAEAAKAPRPVKALPKQAASTAAKAAKAPRTSSGRVRHDEKMTVYVTADELVDIEHARLALRRDHGLAVDRGRLVREALAIVLADLEHHGDDSELVRRLIG
ncbi:hypothetical protein [Nocardioides marmorisolisilvae]|uniref:Cobyrinic acid a,c-diamide synthase n=1 Tax=Nocardioides marmorisolisilvae TaxID=1542737 RepID=A0A3N0DV52_9ACTN|nr:hypothetical protein [Nocardioides marmorisolisilvae]RNL79283.1 hypothetical protein EFL95_09770 [Nocardioides marmorisolisilvae]